MPADGAVPSVVGSPASSAALPVRRVAWHPALVFALYTIPFLLTGLGYEAFREIVHVRGDVHVGDLFALEASLFSVETSRGVRTLSDIIAARQTAFLDFVTGITYFLFMIEVFAVATYCFFRARPKMLELSVGFLLVNLSGWAIWLLYPAAPPWYVDAYGFGPTVLDAAASPAGLSRIDELLGVPIAASFYSNSANVFGAMPSLHVSYATMVAWIAFPLAGKLRWATIAFATSMAFSAVYLRHHYILDVIMGVLLAIPVTIFAQRVVRTVRRFGGGAP